MRRLVVPSAIMAALLVSAAPAPARAEEQPATLPIQDVDVTYRSDPEGPTPGGHVVEQRSRFSVAAQRTRLDLPTPGLFSIMDHRTHTLAVISQPDRKVLETTGAAPARTPALLRRGQYQVAGLPCTEWEVRDSVGQPALTCFTADGVMLRLRRGDQVLAVATRVTYAAQAPDLFQIPDGFERVQRRKQP